MSSIKNRSLKIKLSHKILNTYVKRKYYHDIFSLNKYGLIDFIFIDQLSTINNWSAISNKSNF